MVECLSHQSMSYESAVDIVCFETSNLIPRGFFLEGGCDINSVLRKNTWAYCILGVIFLFFMNFEFELSQVEI